ncbi:HAMP domain-containing histidine kinase [Steroidobacter sp. S1-65]|uniref:histidine kinase n=1 Tax=Steroidobacter gossypii TaxID=2805490 RepID=A0ABS1WTZ1_9GAMM|nr:HAMP domain-containing sensor histidine kinase [Steroidobacter gossypii]MBM0104454.1 HAMP domain-containing histidine kinase [Steroidobacter gossypii]
MKLAELSRVSTVRLLPIYGLLFILWSVLLVGWVQYDTKRYLSGVVDEILRQRMHYLNHIDRQRLPEAMAQTVALDLQGVMLYGLFDQQGRKLVGNIEQMPGGVSLDGVVHFLPGGVRKEGDQRPIRSRGLATRLDTGEVLILARATSVVDEVNAIIYRSLLWGLSLTVIPGLIGGLWLARGPLRRIRALESAAQPIMRGDLHQRLPISERRDELDMLAGIVNSMLQEIERLMSEVKGVCDSIAHDLRTPLTRLRTQLHRMHREAADETAHRAVLEHAISDVDSLLDRFRALLRISELEDMHRRAGFTDVNLVKTIDHVREIYTPLAEDKHITFSFEVAHDIPLVRGDPHLLLEAVSNIVDNAIKFTPTGGSIHLRLTQDAAEGVRIDVIDSGPGICTTERDVVLQRFYRGTCTSKDVSGSGLGLSIVAAIVKLHGFKLQIIDNPSGGAWFSLSCGPAAAA